MKKLDEEQDHESKVVTAIPDNANTTTTDENALGGNLIYDLDDQEPQLNVRGE